MITTSSPHRELVPATLLLAIAVALAFAPDHYLPMLARAFLLQWSLLFVAGGALLWWRGARWMALAALTGCVLLLPQYHQPRATGVVAEEGIALRVGHLNVFQPNRRHGQVLRIALSSGADVLSMQEVDGQWAQVLLAGLGGAYPHTRIVPRDDCYGIALFSKLPLEDVRVHEMEGSPFIEAIVRTAEGPVRLFAVHAASPHTYRQFQRRNAQLARLAGNIAASPMPTVLVGDLNTVHWDRAYRKFRTRSGLLPVNSPGMRTWPSIGPIALIPLDHLLVSPGLGASEVRRFTIPGSDHRGLVADLRIPIASAELADHRRSSTGDPESADQPIRNQPIARTARTFHHDR